MSADEDLPDFVTPIKTGGEEGPPLEMPRDIAEALRKQLDEIDRCQAQAMIDAHRVVIWR